MFRSIFIRTGTLRSIYCRNTLQVIAIQTIRRKFHSSIIVNPNRIVHLAQSTSWLRYYSSDLPSHTKVPLPALSPTMEEGTLISWDKKEGDKLNDGDLLAEIETDKATMAFETPEEGYLAKILVPAGTKGIPVGKIVCIIVENEGDVAAFKDFKDDGAKSGGGDKKPPPPKEEKKEKKEVEEEEKAPPVKKEAKPEKEKKPEPQQKPESSAPSKQGERVYASPMAKRLAEQRNIRLEGKGSGLHGSITSSDLDKMSSADKPAKEKAPSDGKAAPPPKKEPGATYTDIPISNMRAVIAKRLVQSKQQIPHFYLNAHINVDELVKIRTRFNKKLEKDGVKLSFNDFIIKATAMAARKIPEANSFWMESFIRRNESVDVSVAVSTDRGLLTPIIFDAHIKGVQEISKEMKELAAKARDGKLHPKEFQGGTISVSNLGMFDIDHFSAIINPPQSCIIAVGSMKSQLIADEECELGYKEIKTISATLSCDHRVVDGTVGALWLKAFKEYLQDPVSMII